MWPPQVPGHYPTTPQVPEHYRAIATPRDLPGIGEVRTDEMELIHHILHVPASSLDYQCCSHIYSILHNIIDLHSFPVPSLTVK